MFEPIPWRSLHQIWKIPWMNWKMKENKSNRKNGVYSMNNCDCVEMEGFQSLGKIFEDIEIIPLRQETKEMSATMSMCQAAQNWLNKIERRCWIYIPNLNQLLSKFFQIFEDKIKKFRKMKVLVFQIIWYCRNLIQL